MTASQQFETGGPLSAADHVAIATLATEMRYIRQSLDEIRQDVKTIGPAHVTRNEWMQRNDVVDGKFTDVDKRITGIVTDLASKRVPWTSIAAIVISAAVLIFDVLPRVAIP